MTHNISIFKIMGKLLAILVVVIGVMLMFTSKTRKLPKLSPDEWWGPEELRGKFDNTVKPFQIKFEDEMVKDLKQRLKNHRPFAPPLEGVAFEYGFNSNQLTDWIQYWADSYDFVQREKFLNQFPQFTTNIQGLNIHFIRVKPKAPAGVQVLPLLLVHSWPGSVREFYEAIPLLTKHRPGYEFVFEVVIPSLPGYGYSDAAVRPGLAAPQTAVIFKNLMMRLGHKKFYVQGGDWGGVVCSSISTLYPEDILGFHTNMANVYNSMSQFMTMLGSIFPFLVVESHLADRMYPLSSYIAFFFEELGFFHLQATKPDTIGVALTDSPTGLLAYILEKFSTWTRIEHKHQQDGGLKFRFTKDQLIDNIMMYWAPNKITTSMRYYAENLSQNVTDLEMNEIKTRVPTWAFQAKNELFYQPPCIIRTKYPNLLNVTVTEDGGHFLAFELPDALVGDVFTAVKAFQEFNLEMQEAELED